jgi:hypothetical protein
MMLGWPAPSPKADRPYWTCLNRLADILARQIQSILPKASASSSTATVEPKVVWIAEPTDDVLEYWETLATSIRDLGYCVAPKTAGGYPRETGISYRQAVGADLDKADLLIQLLGLYPTNERACADLPFVQIQAEAARVEMQRRDIPVLTWRTPEIRLEEIADPAYKVLLTGVTACGFEEFRQEVLQQLGCPAALRKARGGNLTSVVVNADKPDRDLGKRVLDMLFDLEVDATLVAEPASSQLPAQYFRDLEAQLVDSTGLVIVYGAAQPSWVHAQHAMARKTLSLSRKGVWGALLDGPPEQKPDIGVRSRSLMLLDCRRGVTADPLKRFVDTLRQEAVRV